MVDYRGFFIECIARNVSIEKAAEHLTITPDYLLIKLFSKELFTLIDAVKLHELLQLYGSEITFNSLFTDNQEAL